MLERLRGVVASFRFNVAMAGIISVLGVKLLGVELSDVEINAISTIIASLIGSDTLVKIGGKRGIIEEALKAAVSVAERMKANDHP